MTNKKQYITLLSMVFLLFLVACSDENKEKPSAGQPQAISKKIEKKIEPIKTEKDSINEEKTSAPNTNPNVHEPIEKQIKAAQPVGVKEQNQEKTAESTIDDLSNKDKEFDPTGKLNPFLPFFSDESEKIAEKTDNQKRKREPLTPLEKIDIAQLRLTAITRTPSGNIALVEEANGKGYVLNEGTYIGLNSGKVINVLSDKVVIEEEIENIFGKVSIQERELKLQKPTGE